MKRILVISTLILLGMYIHTGTAQENALYIGWTSVDITPSKPAPLRGQMHKRISKYVRDPITATILAMETKRDGSDKEQAIMISCDLVTIQQEIQDKVRKRISTIIPDFKVDKLFINATHTHTAPNPVGSRWYDTSKDAGIMTEAEYGEFLVDRISEGVVDAWNSRKPGGISWRLGHAVVGHNRRIEYGDGETIMYGPTNTEYFQGVEGANDHGVNMLFCWDETKTMTGIIINVACPSQVVEGEYYISADYWAEVRKELRKRYSNELYVLPQCGAAGDQSPRDLPRRGRGEPNMRAEAGMIEIGRRIADAVDHVYPYAKDQIKTLNVFNHAVKTIHLPKRKVTQKEYEDAVAFYTLFNSYMSLQSRGSESSGGTFSDGSRRIMDDKRVIIERYETQRKDPYYDMELHVLRLGEVVFATNPFELFLDYGLQMMARSNAEQTFLIQLCCDEAGYLPTRRAIRGGGYSSNIYNGIVGPDGGKMLVDETVKLINSIWE